MKVVECMFDEGPDGFEGGMSPQNISLLPKQPRQQQPATYKTSLKNKYAFSKVQVVVHAIACTWKCDYSLFYQMNICICTSTSKGFFFITFWG
ncbi:MAG: hypothetical protein AAGA18_07345 [Verrucomicrobiota bacterium]